MIVCDTAPLVAAALFRDPNHRRCVDLFAGLRMANREMVLPAPIVAEVGYLLERKAGARAEAVFLRALAEGDFTPVDLTAADSCGFASTTATRGTSSFPRRGGSFGTGPTRTPTFETHSIRSGSRGSRATRFGRLRRRCSTMVG